MTSITDQMRTILAQTTETANFAAAQAQIATQAVKQIAGLAPLASPAFTGTPTAPTQAQGSNSTALATTAYLDRLLGVANGIPTLDNTGKIPNSQLPPITVTAVFVVASQAAMLALDAAVGNIAIRTDESNAEYILSALPASTLANWIEIGTSPVLSVAGLTGAILAADLMTALAAAPLASPAFTGNPTASTQSAGNSSTRIATTAFVDTSFAKKASPTFTGTPIVPTATIDTDTGQAASTAFVLGQGAQSGDTPAMDGAAAIGTSTHFARADHVHPTDTSLAPINSPAFTGSPTAPTPTTGDNSTAIATTAFVQASVGSSFSTGDIKPTMKTTADSGWVLLNDTTIGSALSGATHANADAQALFVLLYGNCADADCPVQTSSGSPTTRGAQGSAATAWANNCRMSLPKALGRAFASAGAGSGLTSRALGSTTGVETVALTASQQANMPVTGTTSIYSDGGALPNPSAANNISAAAPGTITGTATGGGTTGQAHQNMQPSTFVNWMIKL